MFDEEMSMMIGISTYSELDYTIDSDTEQVQGSTSPYTGEIRNLAIRSAIVMMSLVGSIIIVFCLERKRINESNELAAQTPTDNSENKDG